MGAWGRWKLHVMEKGFPLVRCSASMVSLACKAVIEYLAGIVKTAVEVRLDGLYFLLSEIGVVAGRR